MFDWNFFFVFLLGSGYLWYFFLYRIRNLTNLRFVSVVGCVCVNLCVFFVEWKNEAGELSEVLTIESVCVIVN